MSCNCEINPVPEERIESFADSGDGAMMTGKRRTGQIGLMEDLLVFLKNKFPEKDIFVIREDEGIEDVLGNSIPDGSIVLIHFVSKVPDWESIIRSRVSGTVTVYCGQELCHQVPVCFKNIVETD